MSLDLPTAYNAKEHETDIYARWENGGCFAAGAGAVAGEPSFCIMIPPPNVTGKLHMGHALNNTLQDTLIRWQRMQGRDTLWQPGCDHAGIATQSVVAKHLDSQGGPSREEMGREAFLEKVWEWKEQYGGSIVQQLRKLGSSCDWSRERFTMDTGLSQAVRENFVKLHDIGLIYRGTRMVNWSPALQTALANDEVEMEEVEGHMWKLRYPLADGSGHIDVETTRPETFFGDTGVAVNPEDPRYKHLIGKQVTLPIVARQIPIVGDDYADPDKGTGAVKITPAHDPNDYEVGKRHELPLCVVMNLDGSMNQQCAHFAGMDRFACREQLLQELERDGVLQSAKTISHAVGHCYRSHVPVEPMVTEQWFVKMKPLAERALAETREGRVRFHPERWTKVYCQWLEEVQDWCISRQIWWGHRIPAWYCDDCGHITVSRQDPSACEHCQGSAIHQDEDVLDTWFSSALWPFSTLGWPDTEAEAFKRFFPTDVLVTDRGIIYFWVARMVMMSLFNLNSRPYSDVYIHGTVLDKNGTKMSKSLGNGIDPLIMIEGGVQDYLDEHYDCPGYGADAVRYTLLDMCTEGQDLKLSPQRFEAGRNFVNKVYNAGRFLLMNLAERPLPQAPAPADLQQLPLAFPEQWILARLQQAITGCQESLQAYRFADYVGRAYRFFRDELCDWYLEWAKRQFRTGATEADMAAKVLAYCFDQVLRLLHPGMPSITEQLWQQLQGQLGGTAWQDGQFLMLSRWPQAVAALQAPELDARMDQLQALISAVRNIRNQQNIADKVAVALTLSAPNQAMAEQLEQERDFLIDRGNLSELTVAVEAAKPPTSISEVVGAITVHVQLAGVVDLDAMRAKLDKQLQAKEKAAAGKRGRLNNEQYLNGAPPEKVQETRDMLAQDETEIAKLQAAINELG